MGFASGYYMSQKLKIELELFEWLGCCIGWRFWKDGYFGQGIVWGNGGDGIYEEFQI